MPTLVVGLAVGLRLGASPARASSDPVVAAAGDIACDPTNSHFHGGAGDPGFAFTSTCHERATSDLIAANPAIQDVLMLGDSQYDCGSPAAFAGSYDPTWGRFKSITHPAVGNHEYADATHCPSGTNGAQGYYSYFGQAASPQQSGCTSNCFGYYSYDVGSWHLIALNTQCTAAGGCGTGSPQYKWLRADLAAHPNRCTLAYWHIPLYSSDPTLRNANSQAFWNLLYAAHADVILNGHSHSYERFTPLDPSGTPDPTGPREFVAGTGGANHTNLSTISPGSVVHDVNTYGVLELTLHASSYDWSFVPQAGQTFTDSGSAACHSAAAADTTAPSVPQGVQASASSATQASVGWQASSDNVGVDHYVVLRDGSAVGLPTGTSFADSGLSPQTTYSYTVEACDLAGNCSAPSSPATATTPPSTSATYTFVPVADSHVDGNSPTTNYGLQPLRVDASPDVRSYLRFVVSGVSGTVASATLQIYATSAQKTGFSAYAVADNSWTETGLTYANQPLGSIAPTPTGATGPVVAGSWTSDDVTPLVSGDGTYSFVIETTNTTGLALSSREDLAHQPQLVVTTR